jgi:hypothetical protein
MSERYYPDTRDLMRAQRVQRATLLSLLILACLIVAGSVAAVYVISPNSSPIGLIAVPVALLAALAVPVIVWNNPRSALYILLVTGLMCGAGQGYQTPVVPTTYIPFWWNLGLAVRWYAGSEALSGVALSPAEIVMIVATLSWLVRGIAMRELTFYRGFLFYPIMAFTLFVGMGAVHGWVTGGDINIILWEIRPQFHFFLVYLLAANLVQKKEHIQGMVWTVLGAGTLMACFLVASYAMFGTTEHGVRGMEHSDALFMCSLMFMIFVGWINATDRRLSLAGIAVLPIALVALLASNRRAGIAAFVIAFIPLLPMLWYIVPHRRKQIGILAMASLAVGAVYFPIAWNASGAWALPARAIRSASDPNERDAGSNNYRYAEDYNLKATRDIRPWLGYGYGKEFGQFIPMPYIGDEKLLRYLPHNSVLWIWMRTGHFGFFAFWMLIASVMILGCQTLRRTTDGWLRYIGLIAVLQFIMLYVYGKYDLQWTSDRQMCFAAILLGVLASLDRIQKSLGGAENQSGEPSEQREAVGAAG